jgi:hypothetical protein
MFSKFVFASLILAGLAGCNGNDSSATPAPAATPISQTQTSNPPSTGGYTPGQPVRQQIPNLLAVGKWTGPITAPDGSIIGTIEIDLQNETVPESVANGTFDQATVLSGMVRLSNLRNSEAAITNASFDSDDGSLAATIAVQDANQTAQTVALSGKIVGATFTGQIQVMGDSTAMTFVATNGSSSTSPSSTVTSKRMQFEKSTYYSTTSPVSSNSTICQAVMQQLPSAPCVGGSVCPAPSAIPSSACQEGIQMTISEGNTSADVNFYNAFDDQPSVQVELTYYSIPPSSNSQQVSSDNMLTMSYLQFQSVIWDISSNELQGLSTSSLGMSTLNCQATTLPSGQGWNCNINNSGTSYQAIFAPGRLSH